MQVAVLLLAFVLVGLGKVAYAAVSVLLTLYVAGMLAELAYLGFRRLSALVRR